MNKEDTMVAGRIKELANMCYQRGIPMCSDFLNLNEQSVAWQMINQLPPVSVKAIGGFDVYGNEIPVCERKMFVFEPKDNPVEADVPIEVLEIVPSNRRFAQELTHRDFLGALLNLGIERCKIGDIFVGEEAAYVLCHKKIAGYIADGLTKVKHTTVLVRPGGIVTDVVIRTQELTVTVASVRLDGMISAAFNLSRSASITLIEEAKIFVNGKLITTNSYNLKDGELVSVRGMGKFRFAGSKGVSKKGRIVVALEKYI